MSIEIPEGFSLVTEDTGSTPVSPEIPEGFTLVTETPKSAPKPVSTLMNPVQEKNPFATANQPVSTEPQLDLVNQRIIQPNLDSDAMQAQEATNVIAKYNNMYKKYSDGFKSISWNKEDREEASRASYVLKNNLLKELKSHGIENVTINKEGKLVAIIDGVEQTEELDSSFLQDLWASKSELAGAVIGGIRGANIGKTFGYGGAAVGGLVGGAAGAFAGKGIDILTMARKQKNTPVSITPDHPPTPEVPNEISFTADEREYIADVDRLQMEAVRKAMVETAAPYVQEKHTIYRMALRRAGLKDIGEWKPNDDGTGLIRTDIAPAAPVTIRPDALNPTRRSKRP